jgi:hypothetical protein
MKVPSSTPLLATTRARRPRRWPCSTTLLAALLGAATLGLAAPARAEPVQVSGRVEGGDALLNPVWNAAKETKSRRFTFRVPSPTVSTKAKVLTAYLPKELCIVVLGSAPGAATKVPARMSVSGGRTTPVTLVVPDKQEVQIENHDPFPHRIYGGDKAKPDLTPSDIEPTKSRRWTPPGVGKFELKDEKSPSILSWIVVEPKTVKTTYPNFKNEFTVDLEPGSYTLQAYFNGAPTGKPLPLEVKPAPAQQKMAAALQVSDAAPATAAKK